MPNAIGGQFLSHYIAVVDYAGLSIMLWPTSAKGRTDVIAAAPQFQWRRRSNPTSQSAS